MPFQGGAPLDHPILEVAKGNVACTLMLAAFRTGSGVSGLYTAAAPITLGTSYASGVLFSAPADSSAATAKLSGVTFAGTFALTLVVSEGPKSADAGTLAHYDYESLVQGDQPLSFWRLDDVAPSTFASDDYAGAKQITLQSRSAPLSWTKHPASNTDAIVSNANRIRVGVNQKAVYLAQATPGSADYAASADVFVASLLQNDQAGVVARASATADTYYFAGLVQWSLIGLTQTRRLELWKYIGGFGFQLGYFEDTPVVNGTRRVSLELVGTTVLASLDGVQRIAVTDTSISAAGFSGIMLGATLGSTQSESAGVHLDNFTGKITGRMRDYKGTNHGSYVLGVSHLSSGALTVPNGCAVFDGVDDYIEATRQVSADFSIELWFKSTQGIGSAAVTWWQQTAGLVDASAASVTGDFGIGLRADGKVLAGTGKTSCLVGALCGDDDHTLVSSGATAYNDGNWHHVVFTRSKTLGAMALYIDGVVKAQLASAGSTHNLDSTTNLHIGRIQSGKGWFAGQIDEVAVYGSVLGASAVLKHYQAGRF